ncbi:MAG: transglutaminase domain-containing protein [Desulfobacterales bacterium]|nr:transglutaminase domain-containing protein [Desulfobacterales bacterium]
MLHFTFNIIHPFASKIVNIKAELMMAEKPNPLILPNPALFLQPENYIESDHPEIVNLANTFKSKKSLQVANSIFSFVSSYIQQDGYIKNERGALYVFIHKKGDCTEFMYLFVALCRANNISSRPIAGYVCPESKIVNPDDYHNWAEFYLDGSWHISDPQKKIFMRNAVDYIAVKIISSSNIEKQLDFNRFQLKDKGLTAKMNI